MATAFPVYCNYQFIRQRAQKPCGGGQNAPDYRVIVTIPPALMITRRCSPPGDRSTIVAVGAGGGGGGAGAGGAPPPPPAAAPQRGGPHTPRQVLDNVGVRGGAEHHPPAAPLRPRPLLHPAHVGAPVPRRSGQPPVIDEAAAGEGQGGQDPQDDDGDDCLREGEAGVVAPQGRPRASPPPAGAYGKVISSHSGRS